MTITLIEQHEYDNLLNIFNTYPSLTYKHKGYDSLDKSKLTEEELSKFSEVEAFLKMCIKGFDKFNHFTLGSKSGKPGVRFQYDWCAGEPPAGNLRSYVGVGYLYLEELLNGFNNN